MNKPVEVAVIQADREALDAIKYCLRTAGELRQAGDCNQTMQAIFWEQKALDALARHRTTTHQALVDALEEAIEAFEPFICPGTQFPESIKAVSKAMDGMTPVNITVTKAQYLRAIAARQALSTLSEAKQ